MIASTPLGVGASELFDRPVVRGPWFWVALWVATAACGFVALIPALFPGGPPVEGNDVIHVLAGISFAAWGLVAWRRRPDSTIGRMLTLTGFGVLLSPILQQIDSPLAFTISIVFGELWIALFAALILSFVTGGKLPSTVDRVLVGLFVLGLLVLQVVVL